MEKPMDLHSSSVLKKGHGQMESMWVSPKITLAGGVGSGCQRWTRRGCCNAPDSGGGPQTRTGTRGLGKRGPNQRAKGQHLIDVRAAWAVDGGDGE